MRSMTVARVAYAIVALVAASSGAGVARAETSLPLPSEHVSARASAMGFVGPQACAKCHETKYDDYRASGHPKKLRPAAEARAWGVPLPDGWQWDDISYVIGGAIWKALFVDVHGYIVTSTGPNRDRAGRNQYNLATGRWADYEPGKKIPYDCGPCHMTGYSKDGRQDDRPGIVGTWLFAGVTCEECHGPGAAHVRQPSPTNILVDASPAACGKCHIRGTPDRIPASGGFIHQHEQYNEYLAGPHAWRLGCATCHDPHRRNPVSVKKRCAECHAGEAREFAGSKMARSGVDCVDCHMPPAGRNAESFGRYVGDIKTHIVKIAIAPTDRMFTDDGKRATGKLTVDFACLRCHGSRDMGWALEHAKGVHTRGK